MFSYVAEIMGNDIAIDDIEVRVLDKKSENLLRYGISPFF